MWHEVTRDAIVGIVEQNFHKDADLFEAKCRAAFCLGRISITGLTGLAFGGLVFTREFPFQIRPEFFEDVRRHIHTKLTAEFGYSINHIPILGLVSH
jgi:hypothetical protein